MSQSLQRRYPGLNYFTTAQQGQFFGRDEEIEELLSLILSEKIVVLFGKSGYGKSSLLRAGIVPRLDAGTTSVIVTPGAYQAGQNLTLVQNTLARLDQTGLNDNPDSAFLENISDAGTLWHRLKRKQSAERRQFLLLFDQFEEFDSYPAEQRTDFKQQLAELLFTRIPQAVRDRSDGLSDDQQALLARAPEVKVVFAVREDRLGVLDSLADKLPAILHKRYRLRGLSDAQARDAVIKPAALPQSEEGAGERIFLTPPFAYNPEALDALLHGLKKDDKEARVEAFLLQICCENIEKTVVEMVREAPKGTAITITTGQLPAFNRLFEEYYRGKIAALPEEWQIPARRMIEDELVKVDAVTGIAYRINVDGRQLNKLRGVDEVLLKRLTDNFLLRSEPNTTSGFSYEVSHDLLVEGVLNSKQEYDTEQARLAAEREAWEEAARLQVDAEKARRRESEAEWRRRRAILLAGGAGLTAVLSIGLLIFTIFQENRFRVMSAKVVENLLSDANKLIFHLQYDDAWKKASDAAQLGERKTEVAKSFFEIAYFYGEAGIWDKAIPTAQQSANLLGENALFSELEDSSTSDADKRLLFRSTLKQLNPGWMDSLNARYFPCMSDIPAGVDTLGSNSWEDNFYNWEDSIYLMTRPHVVTLSAFKIAKTETTWWQYFLFCIATGKTAPEKPADWGGEGDNPVVNINWYDAVDYANWLSNHQGLPIAIIGEKDKYIINLQAGYRLPTEAEWEYAARANSNLDFAGSDTLSLVGWFHDNSSRRTHSVARVSANAFGLYDMSGNAWEWCWDWYGEYANHPGKNPIGPALGTYRILRGGSWPYDARFCRVAQRNYWQPIKKDIYVGFRVVSSL